MNEEQIDELIAKVHKQKDRQRIININICAILVIVLSLFI